MFPTENRAWTQVLWKGKQFETYLYEFLKHVEKSAIVKLNWKELKYASHQPRPLSGPRFILPFFTVRVTRNCYLYTRQRKHKLLEYKCINYTPGYVSVVRNKFDIYVCVTYCRINCHIQGVPMGNDAILISKYSGVPDRGNDTIFIAKNSETFGNHIVFHSCIPVNWTWDQRVI